MPEIILITLAKNRFHVFKNEDRNKKIVNPSPINGLQVNVLTQAYR